MISSYAHSAFLYDLRSPSLGRDVPSPSIVVQLSLSLANSSAPSASATTGGITQLRPVAATASSHSLNSSDTNSSSELFDSASLHEMMRQHRANTDWLKEMQMRWLDNTHTLWSIWVTQLNDI